MTKPLRLQVVAQEPLSIARSNRLADMYMLSPYIWRQPGEKGFHILLRAVPRRDDEPRLKMAEIWHGVSKDGLHFEMDVAPAVFPGPDLVDLDGCEDPTVITGPDGLHLWYTGFNQKQEVGRLLLARGPDVSRLAKAGVALESRPPFANPKEAAVAPVAGGGWRMYFEYAHEEASLIGQAFADNLDGPWEKVKQAPLKPRKGAFDDWHLSPGPILDLPGDRRLLFYNGALREAQWRIGWAVFDPAFDTLLERCEEPLITPETAEGSGSDIAFAASAVEAEGEVWLYYSQSDQDLRRARLTVG